MDKWPEMSLLLEGVVYTHLLSGLLWPIFVGKYFVLKIWQAWYMLLSSNMLILASTCDFFPNYVSPVSLVSLVSLVSPVSPVSPVSLVSLVSPVPTSFYTLGRLNF